MNDLVAKCPLCGQPAVLKTGTTRIRRGGQEASAITEYWECPGACVDPDGHAPFQFEDEAVMERNDMATRQAWRAKYGTELPTRRKPGRKPREHRSSRVPVLLTDSEQQQLDHARGRLSRSEFIRLRALGTSGSPSAPQFPLVELEGPNGPHRGAA